MDAFPWIKKPYEWMKIKNETDSSNNGIHPTAWILPIIHLKKRVVERFSVLICIVVWIILFSNSKQWILITTIL